jgi:hypothetical protein
MKKKFKLLQPTRIYKRACTVKNAEVFSQHRLNFWVYFSIVNDVNVNFTNNG